MVELIGKLYEVEAHARAEQLDLAAERQDKSVAIVADIPRWLDTTVATSKSSLGKAILYALDLWPELARFLTDPRIPIDNNATERGTKVAALFYTLIESAKLVGANPKQYLREATLRAIASPGTVTLPRELLIG